MYRSCPGRHEDSSSEVNPSMSQAVHESRATMKSLSESSQVSSSWAFMDVMVILLTVSCDHKSNCQIRSEPPLKGGTVMTMRKQRRPGSGFQACHNQKQMKRGEHAPSFIGEMHPSVVWSQSATYWIVSAKLSNMQKTPCK